MCNLNTYLSSSKEVRHIFLDFDRTLFDTESFYNSLEITYIEGIISGAIGADLTKFLYPDAVSFLQYCRNADYSCHLLTFGRRNIQECKFKLTNIETYFDQLFYVEQGSKAEVIKTTWNHTFHVKRLYLLMIPLAT